QRRHRPGEHEREPEAVRRVLVLGQAHHEVLEGQQRAGVHLQRQVQVERASARLPGVQVHLPRLAQRVRLDEVPLVVHVEAVVDGVILQIGDEACDVDGGHASSLPCPTDRPAPGGTAPAHYGQGLPWMTVASSPSCTTPPTPCDAPSTGSTTGARPTTRRASTAATWSPTPPSSRSSTGPGWAR